MVAVIDGCPDNDSWIKLHIHVPCSSKIICDWMIKYPIDIDRNCTRKEYCCSFSAYTWTQFQSILQIFHNGMWASFKLRGEGFVQSTYHNIYSTIFPLLGLKLVYILTILLSKIGKPNWSRVYLPYKGVNLNSLHNFSRQNYINSKLIKLLYYEQC